MWGGVASMNFIHVTHALRLFRMKETKSAENDPTDLFMAIKCVTCCSQVL